MTQAPSLDAVVVDYHTGAHLRRLLASLATEGVSRVIVVDNSTTGATPNDLTAASPVEVVRQRSNTGFGGGVNAGVRRASSELVLVSNPDVVVAPGTVRRLVAELAADERLAIVAPRLLEADGTIHQSARAFPTITGSAIQAFAGLLRPGGRLSTAYRRRNWDASESRTVDWVSGAFFLVRKSAFEEVGGFDESYFMYVEEVDLCWRLKGAGWKVRYVPEAQVVHSGGASAAAHPYAMALSQHRSLWRFARRTARKNERLLLPLVAAGLTARLAIVLGRAAWQRTLGRLHPRALAAP